MAKEYYFVMDEDDLTVIVVDEIGPFNSWKSEPDPSCLITSRGSLSAEDDGFYCNSGTAGNDTILILRDASWKSKVGDFGQAEILLSDISDSCNSNQEWELVEIK